MEMLFLLVLSTMYPYWTWDGLQSSLTSPRVSSCDRWPCPLKSSRLMLTFCPVCASNNHGCDREPHLLLLTLRPDLGLPAMCNFEPIWAEIWQDRSSSTTESEQQSYPCMYWWILEISKHNANENASNVIESTGDKCLNLTALSINVCNNWWLFRNSSINWIKQSVLNCWALLYYVAAKAIYIRLLHGKIGFLGFFSALARYKGVGPI